MIGDQFKAHEASRKTCSCQHVEPVGSGKSFHSRRPTGLQPGRERENDPGVSLSHTLARVSADLIGVPLAYDEAAIAQILSARHFIEIRRTLGGPAPEETARAARQSRAALESDEAWWNGATTGLADAERNLAARSAAL